MGRWLAEVKENVADDVVVHVVGTKSDVVAQEPGLRKVPFERCIAYVAENLYRERVATPPITMGAAKSIKSSDSKRSSGFWGQEIGWDCCHEISAKVFLSFSCPLLSVSRCLKRCFSNIRSQSRTSAHCID